MFALQFNIVYCVLSMLCENKDDSWKKIARSIPSAHVTRETVQSNVSIQLTERTLRKLNLTVLTQKKILNFSINIKKMWVPGSLNEILYTLSKTKLWCWKYQNSFLLDSWKYYNDQRSFRDLLETYWRPIGNLLETHWKPIGEQHSRLDLTFFQ